MGQAVAEGRAAGSVLKVERRAIEPIPGSERHGRPNSLFTLWFASNVQVTALVTGALAVVLGLNLVWAIVALVIGNLLGGLFMAYHSAQGPKMGVPQMIQSRAQFGFFGASLPLVIVVLMYLGFFVSSDVLGGQAIQSLFGIPYTAGVVISSVVILLMTWVGYDLFHAYDRVVAVISGLFFLAVMAKLAGQLPSHVSSAGVSGGTVLLVISIAASWQITWAPYVSDYSRYLPETVTTARTFAWTFLGSAVGGGWVMIVGALAALVDTKAVNTNASGYLAGLFGSGPKPLLLVVIFLGILAANVENLYGAFLSALTTISPSGRIGPGPRLRVLFTLGACVIGTAVAIEASNNFLTNLSDFVLFLLYFLVPWTAINLVDFYLVRRGRYDVAELFRIDGRYGRINWASVVIYLVTVLVELPFMNSSFYEGPVAKAIGGGDVAWMVGLVVAGGLYLGASRLARRGVFGGTDASSAALSA